MIRFLLIAAIVSAMLMAACGDDGDDSSSEPNGNDATEQPTNSGDESTDPADGATVAPASETPIANVCQPNPAPGTAQTVVIESPAPLTKHRGSVVVTGQIAAFEATYKIRIFDADGAVISGATGMTAQGQALSPFTLEVTAQVVSEQPACIWVYEESARDGSPTNIAQLPVVIQP